MVFIAFFGGLLMVFSLVMIFSPQQWAKGILRFSQQTYFHPFEIISRVLFGMLFIAFAQQTLYPGVMSAIGYLLLSVGVGLAFLPPEKHRQFAVWSASRFEKSFRVAGIVALPFGAFLIYASVS